MVFVFSQALNRLPNLVVTWAHEHPHPSNYQRDPSFRFNPASSLNSSFSGPQGPPRPLATRNSDGEHRLASPSSVPSAQNVVGPNEEEGEDRLPRINDVAGSDNTAQTNSNPKAANTPYSKIVASPSHPVSSIPPRNQQQGRANGQGNKNSGGTEERHAPLSISDPKGLGLSGVKRPSTPVPDDFPPLPGASIPPAATGGSGASPASHVNGPNAIDNGTTGALKPRGSWMNRISGVAPLSGTPTGTRSTTEAPRDIKPELDQPRGDKFGVQEAVSVANETGEGDMDISLDDACDVSTEVVPPLSTRQSPVPLGPSAEPDAVHESDRDPVDAQSILHVAEMDHDREEDLALSPETPGFPSRPSLSSPAANKDGMSISVDSTNFADITPSSSGLSPITPSPMLRSHKPLSLQSVEFANFKERERDRLLAVSETGSEAPGVDPRSRVASPVSDSLFIGGLDVAYGWTEDRVWEVFSRYGEVVSVRLVFKTLEYSGHSFVKFSESSALGRAIAGEVCYFSLFEYLGYSLCCDLIYRRRP